MFEICAFANIRRPAVSSLFNNLLKQIVGSNHYELTEKTKAGVVNYYVRVTEVTGAGGKVVSFVEYDDKFDALDAYNKIASNNVVMA